MTGQVVVFFAGAVPVVVLVPVVAVLPSGAGVVALVPDVEVAEVSVIGIASAPPLLLVTALPAAPGVVEPVWIVSVDP